MKKLPFLRPLAVLTLAIFFAVGWWLHGAFDRRNNRQMLERCENSLRVDSVLTASIWINKLIEVAGEAPAEREIQFENFLLLQLRNLALTEPYHSGDAHDIFLMHASNSLAHLGVSDYAGLQERVRGARLVERAKAPFLDHQHPDHNQVRDFVARAIAYDRERWNTN